MEETPHENRDPAVDPDLLVLDEGDAARLMAEDGFEPEPVDSYVPPYVPDPSPESTEDRRVRVYRTRSPRWFRVLFLSALALILAAAGSILHRQGYLERWFAELRGPAETTTSEVAPRPEPMRDPAPVDPAPEPVVPPPDPVPDPPEPPFVLPEPTDERLPDPAEAPGPKPPRPLVVEVSEDRRVTLLEGEILVELRNGNFLKGRLHKVTRDKLRLAMAGGYVDVELSRLRARTGPGEGPLRPLSAYPRATIQLVTGEILRGRLKESTDEAIELVFPSGKIVLRRDMVKYVLRR